MPRLLFDRSNRLVEVERNIAMQGWDGSPFTVTVDRTILTEPFLVTFNTKEKTDA